MIRYRKESSKHRRKNTKKISTAATLSQPQTIGENIAARCASVCFFNSLSVRLSSTQLSNGFANHEQTLNSTKTWRLQCEHDELAQHFRNITFWLFSCWNGAGRCWSRDAHTAAQVSLTDDSYTESVRWAANKRLEISNFNFKFRRARNYEVIGLVLGCIDADFCK